MRGETGQCPHNTSTRPLVGLVEGAVAAALGGILGMLIVYRLPQGGSVSLAGVVPVWVVSMRRGPWVGMTAGCVLGILNFMQNPQSVHPLQPLLDYPVAFGLLGLAGFFPLRPILGIAISSICKISAHVVTGVLFFSAYAGGSGYSPLLYSLIYNLTVGLPDLFVASIVFVMLKRQAPHLLVRRVGR